MTLIALLAIVGTEWVAGSTMPTTPHGARSMTHRPDASLRASMRIASTPSTFFTIRSFSILWSRRPMPVSSSSRRPSSVGVARRRAGG